MSKYKFFLFLKFLRPKTYNFVNDLDFDGISIKFDNHLADTLTIYIILDLINF